MDEKETLHRYLRVRRDNLLGKLDGLREYDVRRPLTPTGTNLLGLIKHVAFQERSWMDFIEQGPTAMGGPDDPEQMARWQAEWRMEPGGPHPDLMKEKRDA